MTNEYYLIHGRMLDSEHTTMDAAIERANAIMSEQGIRHDEIRIGNRALNLPNDLLVVYIKLAEFPRKEAL